MADIVDAKTRSRMMSGIRGRDTKPEMAVRRLLHGMGYRYRLHARELPGRPDIVFRRRKLAIFVHGCFWHQHPGGACNAARIPKSRPDFWQPKLAANRARDETAVAALESAGWAVHVVWECELKQPEAVRERLRKALSASDPQGYPKCTRH